MRGGDVVDEGEITPVLWGIDSLPEFRTWGGGVIGEGV
jgi:hypothetical protein